MGRQHIHLAPALEVGGDMDNVIAPRNGSTLLIYLDLDKMLQAGLEVYVSANGVVLTPGDEQGCVGREMWNKVERVRGGERRVVWDAERGEVE
jgi:2'-phosphotransferase